MIGYTIVFQAFSASVAKVEILVRAIAVETSRLEKEFSTLREQVLPTHRVFGAIEKLFSLTGIFKGVGMVWLHCRDTVC
jgi:hypothetical protein